MVMDEKMQETMQEVLEKLDYMENAIQVLLQLTTMNSERVADMYNTIMRAGIIREDIVRGGSN